MNIAVIFAGGAGKRMHSKDRPKQFLQLYNKPIIIHTLEQFESCSDIDAIVVVCIKDWIEHLKQLLYKFRIEKVGMIVSGADTGQMSIYKGLVAAKELSGNNKSVVLIHDGVRPIIDSDLIRRNIAAVRDKGSSITTSVVKETILVVDEKNNKIKEVPPRKDSRVAKAPQSFWLDEILELHERAQKDGIFDCIDSCTLMQMYGHSLYLVDGSDENIKVTTPEDFYIMRALLEAKENAQIYGYGDV